MLGGIVQTSARSFLSLKYGMDKAVQKLQQEYISLISKQKERICKRKNDDLRKRIKKIISHLQTLLKQIKSILKILKKLLSFIKVVKKILKGLTILVKVLKLFPLPARWALVGMIIKLSDLLSKLSSLLKSALLVVLGVDFVISYTTRTLRVLVITIENQIKSLEVVSQQLKDCGDDKNQQAQDILDSLGLDKNDFLSSLGFDIDDLGGDQDLKNNSNPNSETFGLNSRILDLLDSGALLNNLGDDLDLNLNNLKNSLNDLKNQMGELLNSSNTYKGFTFKIFEEEVVDKNVVAIRRYAVAINMDGIIALTGGLSFATDTQVLIDELKLRIDSAEMTGYTTIKKSDTNINNIGDDNINTTNELVGEGNINKTKTDPDSGETIILEPKEEIDEDIEKEILSIIDPKILDPQFDETEDSDFVESDEDIPMIESGIDVIQDLGFESENEIETDAAEAEDDLEDLIEGGDKKERSNRKKYENKQKRFVRMLTRKAANGDQKAKIVLGKIVRGEIKLKDAKAEWFLLRGSQ